MASRLDIYNLALTFLDLSSTVQSENDNSTAAGQCRRWYHWARHKVLERAHWDFATKTPALALLLDQSTVPQSQVTYPGFRYVYVRPVDCLRMLAVTTQYGLRQFPGTRSWWRDATMAPMWGPYRPPYREALDQINFPSGQSINILTDQDAAYAVYVTDVPNVNLWTSSFQEAVAWQLAVPLAGPLSANQNAKARAVKQAEESITTALAIGLNERQNDPYPDSPAISCRY